MLLATVIGVSIGTVAALRQNTALDKIVMGFAMTGISVPVFVDRARCSCCCSQ